MENRTLKIEKDKKSDEKKEEKKISYPRSTVEMLEQTLQIA